MRPSRFVAVVLATIILAACGGSDPDDSSPSDAALPTTPATTPATPAATAAPTPTASTEAASPATPGPTAAGDTTPPTTPTTPTPASSAATTAPVDLAAWQTLPITDVDGTTFTLADLVGKPVLVETFATWCSNCRAQLGDTNQAAAEIGDAAHVVALSVETDLDSGEVADYAVDEGFDNIRFAVMSPEMLAALVDAFGNTVANPPTTPKIVVDAAGRAGDLTTGYESPDELVAQVAAAG